MIYIITDDLNNIFVNLGLETLTIRPIKLTMILNNI